ncbi:MULTISPECIES: hypothetical protein [Bacillaceae]|uniref:Uncharacterized protein n=1 Tax=Evansella alkalicola TaxID=745819 RepID=A0ABS6JSC9_9BACI|nr:MULTISPECIES: hypothetical protein [Bacillaceae]MBU9720614.1 hypothetical protein [Bacillus alkalicola]
MNEKEDVLQTIIDFTEGMIIRRNTDADRTWYYILKGFFEYIQEENTTGYPHYTENTINSYLNYLAEKENSPFLVNRQKDIIISFSKYINKSIDPEKIKNPKVTMEIPLLVEEADINDTENLLYQQVSRIRDEVKKVNQPTYDLLPTIPYEKFRDGMRNYLIFRLIIETGVDDKDILQLNIDSLYDNSIRLNNKKIPLQPYTIELLKEYISFRKEYDKWIFEQKLIQDVNFAGKRINELVTDDEMKHFFTLTLQEKLGEIEDQLTKQLMIEENIQELEDIDDEKLEKEIEALETDADHIAAKINEMKKIIVFERKIADYEFNDALFIINNLRVTSNFITETMKKEAFPIPLLQNTAYKRWEDAGLKATRIKKTYISSDNIEKDNEEHKRILESGFVLPKRSFEYRGE